ncbi:MAG: hypothetical protein K2L82_13190 [Lachnospiraceae bacterium]|nr:hypothetical protein [Lachnospiraceae bacterium]
MPKKILNILLIMGVAIVLAVLIYIYGETIDNYSFEMAEIEENVSPKESDSNEVWTDFTESEEASQVVQNQEEAEEPSYFFTCEWVDYSPEHLTSEGFYDENRYGMGILQIEIPDDKERENRINQMLVEEGMERLPSGREKEWWKMVKMHVDYRSNRYLCWHYIPRASFSEDYEWENLYFTLDLKKEKLLEYPGEVLNSGEWGNLYKEMEESWEKTVEEQDALQSERGYTLHEIQSECDGTVFPTVEVTGLADKMIQNRINEHLQEGLRACIENKGWEDDTDRRQYLFDETRIFVSYKSARWLSIVYSIPTDSHGKWDDEICDLPVIIDIQAGERVMLDDLMEVEGLKNWMVFEYGWTVKSDNIEQFNGLVRTERENLEDMYYTGKLAMQHYQNDWLTFYLYRGKLILLDSESLADIEIPLPEIYEYLKVDPWYD